jgi:hypothetical protein
VVFCPIAGGLCQGRSKCRLWIRGRILNSDTKLLAAQLARFLLQDKSPQSHSAPGHDDFTVAFWQAQGLADIRREVLMDRFLDRKVREIEILAAEWVKSPGFLETLNLKELKSAKASAERHTQRCKSPP